MPDHLLTSAQTPPIVVPTDTFVPGSVPPVTPVLTALDEGPGSLTTPFQELSGDVTLAFRHGGGGYGVAQGLEIEADTGLNVTVTAGVALIDGPVVNATDYTLGLADNALNYVYITRAGTITKATSTDPDAPPTLPDFSVYLGRVEMDTGAMVGDPDYSRRITVISGQLWMTTADTGAPDVAPDGIRLFAITDGGIWVWTGASWETYAESQTTKVSNDDTTPGYLEGKLSATDGLGWEVVNDGGDEVLRAKISTAIAVAKGGSGATTAADARANFGAAASGANTDITSLQGCAVLKDSSGNEWLAFSSVASAVNFARIYNAATGNGVRIVADGSDTDVHLLLESKGAGGIYLNGVLIGTMATQNASGVAITGGTAADLATFRTVRNETGGTLAKGTVVYLSGAYSASVPKVAKARANSLTTLPAVGVVAADIANNAVGLVQLEGVLSGLDTSGLTAGNPLFVSAATAGALVTTAPTGTDHIQPLGTCLTSHATTGAIYLNPAGGLRAADPSPADGSVTGAKLHADLQVTLPSEPDFSFGLQVGDNRTVTITVYDAAGNTITPALVDLWLSESAGAGQGSTPDGGVSFATGVVLQEVGPDVYWRVITGAAGVIEFTVNSSIGHTWYLNLAWGGAIYSSPPLVMA